MTDKNEQLGNRKKKLFEKMLRGVDMVLIGVFDRLAQRFKARYGEEKADLLAASVTNELFSAKPSNADAKKFLMSNKVLVERELSNLREDEEICNAVTQAVRVKAMISYETSGNAEESLVEPLEKLIKLGILVQDGDVPMPSDFLSMANDFFQGK